MTIEIAQIVMDAHISVRHTTLQLHGMQSIQRWCRPTTSNIIKVYV